MTELCRSGRRRAAGQAVRLTAALLLGLWLTGIGPAGAERSTQKPGADIPMTFQADEVEYDEEHSLTVAKGRVEISQGKQILLADVVTYNQRSDTVTASGNVSLMSDDGQVVFADYMELRDSMNNVFAHDVRLLMNDRSRLVANAARRTNGNRLDLRKVVYSPCDLCQSDPSKPPVWQLKANQLTDDKDLQKLEFRDAVMEIEGWPIFYTPYIVTPDPSVKRASGFLTPSFGSSTALGFHIGLPYYQTLGPDADMTIFPRFTTEAGQDLAAEYRQRFSNGEFTGMASIDYSNVGFAADPNVKNDWRWHVDEAGVWDIDDTYRTGFKLQRVSDQTYLARFNFSSPILGTEVTRAYLEGFPDNGSLDVSSYTFQPLSPGLVDATQPIVLPVINRDWQFNPESVGGTLKFNANLLDIGREVGTQTRRLSGTAGWDRTFRDGLGSEYKFQVTLRGDAYSINGLSDVSNPDLPSAFFSQNGMPPAQRVPYDFFATRAFPQMGLTWDYPVIRHGDPFDLMVQPTVATFIGPNGGNEHRIPNEDSLGYQFRDSDLFRADRLQGYDLLDTGQRVDYGLNLGAYDKNGGNYRMLIGQSYRAEPNSFVPPGSGMDQRLSDIVGRIVLAPSSYLDMIYRFRFDKTALSNRGQELALNVGPPNLKFSAAFLLVPAEQPSQLITVPGSGNTILYGKREQLSIGLNAKLTRYWSLVAGETINLSNATNIVNGIVTPQASSTTLQSSIQAIYQDECMAFIATGSQSAIRNGDVTPGYTVMFSIVFKNIGGIAGNVLSVAPGS